MSLASVQMAFGTTTPVQIRDIRRPRTIPKGFDLRKATRWGIPPYANYTTISTNTSYTWGNLYGNAQRTS